MKMHDRNRFLRAAALALIAITATGIVACAVKSDHARSPRPKKPFPP